MPAKSAQGHTNHTHNNPPKEGGGPGGHPGLVCPPRATVGPRVRQTRSVESGMLLLGRPQEKGGKGGARAFFGFYLFCFFLFFFSL
eukprot:NODE_5294_length_587_cov_143.936803_g4585_i0.p4 GENE.NODE_5294_length_587_cov_143.936803_g4585_i0~~NODE_5294_length_587_cov_143.936803_g4585_i0.p4  ORF type:complete len:86 (-),score=3.38 NODE_5294_length_587_cov_143.936803_g4585_i0:53-310(-)